jgi:hypothetical protein
LKILLKPREEFEKMKRDNPFIKSVLADARRLG